jgi:uncharacterized protein (DUF305 family)
MNIFVKSTPMIRPLLASLVCTAAFATGAVSAQSATGSKGSEQLSHSMMSGMEGMKQMKTTGDVDKDFAMMMKMHHEQALEMAKIELDQGKSPELKKMAQKIIDGQKREIAQFDKWMQSHK